jgi:uncharacterized protein (DUF433 family)
MPKPDPKLNPRLQKQADHVKSFEQQTGRPGSAFSPTLRAKKTDIMMWADQGKNEDQILANLPGVSREELKNFMKAHNITIKQIHSRKRV